MAILTSLVGCASNAPLDICRGSLASLAATGLQFANSACLFTTRREGTARRVLTFNVT
jgi:hypothetical protein